MTKTLIVPGLYGSTGEHWQKWWSQTDGNAILVDLPSPQRPIREVWEAALAAQILAHPNSVLIGHSLGASLIARMLPRWPALKVRAAMLVAPADTAGSEKLHRFGPVSTRPLGVPAVVVASRNDPWMDFSKSRDLAAQWGADLIDMGFAGHINTASGYGPWPGGKVIRDNLLEQGVRTSAAERVTRFSFRRRAIWPF